MRLLYSVSNVLRWNKLNNYSAGKQVLRNFLELKIGHKKLGGTSAKTFAVLGLMLFLGKQFVFRVKSPSSSAPKQNPGAIRQDQ
jgi:hypothetical protein